MIYKIHTKKHLHRGKRILMFSHILTNLQSTWKLKNPHTALAGTNHLCPYLEDSMPPIPPNLVRRLSVLFTLKLVLHSNAIYLLSLSCNQVTPSQHKSTGTNIDLTPGTQQLNIILKGIKGAFWLENKYKEITIPKFFKEGKKIVVS